MSVFSWARCWMRRPTRQRRVYRPFAWQKPRIEQLEQRNLLDGGLGQLSPLLVPPTQQPIVTSTSNPPVGSITNPGQSSGGTTPGSQPFQPGEGSNGTGGTVSGAGSSTTSSGTPAFDVAQGSRFITALYLDLLHRLPQPGEVTPWVNALAAGWQRDQVALLFTTTLEYRIDQVTTAYRQYLGRNPDWNGLAGWVGALQGGFSEDAFRALIMASPEAYARAGGQPAQWVAYAYQNALGRDPEAAGLAGWTQFLQAGGSRGLAAASILTGPEAHQRDVALAYPEMLARPADAAAIASWAPGLDRGMTVSQLLAGLAGSQEYFDGSAGVDLPPSASQQAAVSDAAGAHHPTISDGLTNDPLLVAQGTGSAWVPFALTVDGLPEAYARVGPDGTWHIGLPAPLLEGPHTLAALPVASAAAADPNSSFLIGVALTPPRVTVAVPRGVNPAPPTITVTVTPNPLAGLHGLMHIAVDLNHDGNFTGPGEQDQTVAALNPSSTRVTLNPLAQGTYQVQVQVGDLAGNVGVSSPLTVEVGPSSQSSQSGQASPGGPSSSPGENDDRRIKIIPGQGTLQPPSPSDPVNGLGSQALQDLSMTYLMLQALPSTSASAGSSTSSSPLGSSGPTPPAPPQPTVNGWHSLDEFLAFMRQDYVFDDKDNLLVRVRVDSLINLAQAEADLKTLGMKGAQVVMAQNLVVGYVPFSAMMELPMTTGFLAATPVYAALHRAGVVTSQGDAALNSFLYRTQTGLDGSGVVVGAISDSVNQVDSHVDSNPDKGVAESQRTGDLPASGVNILQDGSATDTDEGRGILEVVHDIAPGAQLAFTTSDGGPQAMAQGIVALATKANARVIVDDVSYPDEPFFNDGVVAQAVDQVVNQNNVLYVTSAGNEADHAWTDSFRPVTTTVGGQVTGKFENFDSGSGQNVLQHFTLKPGQTLDLAFQWDAPFLEGGSPNPNFKVPNNVGVLVLDGNGNRVLKMFDDDTERTGEALQRVIFTNDGSFGSNDFTLAFQLVDGPAPTQLKWIRFDNGAPAEYQGAPAIWGHAGARGAITVGAVPFDNPQGPESFSSQGKVTILFDAGGHRLTTPEIRTKPDVAGPDRAWTANFPGLPAGQSLPPGTYPVFTGTSAAAAHIAGVAALLEQRTAGALAGNIGLALLKSAQPVASSGWDSQAGAGLVELTPLTAAPAPPPTTLHVGPIVDVSAPLPKPHNTGGTTGTGTASGQPAGSSQFLNAGPPLNVDTSMRPFNEWEEDIAVDPTNPNRLFLASNQDTETTGLFGAFSTDAGATWTGRFMADGSDSLTQACCDPSVAWDNFGNLFLAYLDNTTTLAVLALSTDGGQTFAPVATFAAQDQPKVTVGANSVWVVFNNGDLEAAGAVVSGLGAVGAFPTPEVASNLATANFGTITIGPTGQVLVSFQDAGSGVGPDTIMTALDPDGLGGAGFNTAVAATPTTVGGFRPIAAQPTRTIDAEGRVIFDNSPGPHHGRVYLDYTDAPSTTSDDTNIFVRFSDDNGTTWSPAVRVNDDTGTASQFFPRLKIDQTNGDIAVSWYDCRNDIGSGPGDTDGVPNDNAEFFAALSHTGGVSFLANQQIAAGPSSAVANPNGGNEYGDYTGLAFNAGIFYPAWADNSNSTGNNPDGALSGFDIYTAAVKVPPPAVLVVGDDRFELNDTSERATDFGALAAGDFPVPSLTIDRHANGLFDYDWYRWSVSSAGTATITLSNIQANGDDLHTRVYTLNSFGTLIELGSSRLLGGVTTQQVAVSVAAGEPLLVWVYGFNHALGLYDLDVNLA